MWGRSRGWFRSRSPITGSYGVAPITAFAALPCAQAEALAPHHTQASARDTIISAEATSVPNAHASTASRSVVLPMCFRCWELGSEWPVSLGFRAETTR